MKKKYKIEFLGRLPLYVQNLPVLKLEKQSEVVCGTSYTILVQTPTRTLRYLPELSGTYPYTQVFTHKLRYLLVHSGIYPNTLVLTYTLWYFRPVTYVWVNATDGYSANLKVFMVQVNLFSMFFSFFLREKDEKKIVRGNSKYHFVSLIVIRYRSNLPSKKLESSFLKPKDIHI